VKGCRVRCNKVSNFKRQAYYFPLLMDFPCCFSLLQYSDLFCKKLFICHYSISIILQRVRCCLPFIKIATNATDSNKFLRIIPRDVKWFHSKAAYFKCSFVIMEVLNLFLVQFPCTVFAIFWWTPDVSLYSTHLYCERTLTRALLILIRSVAECFVSTL